VKRFEHFLWSRLDSECGQMAYYESCTSIASGKLMVLVAVGAAAD